MTLDPIIRAGAEMANLLYNLEQTSFGTPEIRASMKEAQTAWDAARRALSTAPSGQAPLEGVTDGCQVPTGFTLIGDRHFNALAEGMAEIKATVEGHSKQPIQDIVSYVEREVAASPSPIQGFGRSALLPASAEPVAVECVDCVSWENGYEEPADPIWRVVIDGYCADFVTATAAQNVADAINRRASPPASGAVEATHRHVKRGSEYVLIGIGKMQAENWIDHQPYKIPGGGHIPVDMREVAIYRSISDGSLWARPREEFEDGRFEALPAAPTEGR